MPADFTAVSPPSAVVQFFKACADETRLTIVSLLSHTDLRVGEIVERLDLPLNVVSYHLKQLRILGLMRDRRSSQDARDIYYSLDLHRLQTLFVAAGNALPLIDVLEHKTPTASRNLDRPLRVLFLCTHNSARSQLAEALLRKLGGSSVEVASAGTQPTEVHPETLAILRGWDVNPAMHTSKHVSQFADQPFDYTISVCDRVREKCPIFPGDPTRLHWSTPDPLAVADVAERRQAFEDVSSQLNTRIRYLLLVPDPITKQGIHWQPDVLGQERS